jgi:DNA-binding MurR/RpiR family transcriptional regulator
MNILVSAQVTSRRWAFSKLTEDDIEAAKAMLANPDIGVTEIAHRLGVSPATPYRFIPAHEPRNPND